MNPTLQAKALRGAIPLTAYLELTYRCNWACLFCYNPRRNDSAPLSLAEWTAVLDDLRELGGPMVILTGGEPLAHPHFREIAREVRARHLSLKVFTNGALVNHSIARLLAELSAEVEVSIHGATAEVHDTATARRGSFDAMMNGIEALRASRVRLQLKTPLTRLNEHQVEEMYALAQSLGLPYRFDPTITARDDGDPAPLDYSVTREGLHNAMASVARLGLLKTEDRFEGGANCGLGRTTLAIDPEGNIYPCMKWRHSSAGNVRTTRLSEMWKTSHVRQQAATVATEANSRILALGAPLSLAAFCPAQAALNTGNAVDPDAAFLRRAEAEAAARDAADAAAS